MHFNWLSSLMSVPSRCPGVSAARKRRMRSNYGAQEQLEERTLLAGTGLGLLNLPPLALPDTYNVIQEVPLQVSISVLGNDTDPNGDLLNAQLLVGPLHGSVVLDADGTFLYTPDAGYVGLDVFTYLANDGLLGSLLPAVVTLNILPASNQPPVANNDTFNVAEDSVLNLSLGTILDGVLANDSDAELVPLTAFLVSPPQHGTLTFLPIGTFIYTPNPNFSGTDSFTYQASDLLSLSNIATATINVLGRNDLPVANSDSYTTATDTTLTVAVGSGVLANDTDVDGNPLTAILVDDVTDGTLTLNANGSFSYIPDAGFDGEDTFTYRVNDGTANGNIATVTITVSGTPGAAPVAVNDTYTLAEDGSLTTTLANDVLGNDTDADLDPLTATLVANVSNGTLVFNGDGTFVYTPNANFSGTDTFTYQANDGSSNSNIATVTLTVTGSNDPPVGLPDAYDVDEGSTLVVAGTGVLANDSDPDGDSLTVAVLTQPANGNLTLNEDGSFTYIPDALYHGTDSFTYQMSDGTTTSNAVTVTITVNSVNDLPLAIDDAFTVGEDDVLTVVASGVLGNDSDADNDPLTATLVTGPSNGTLSLNADGSLVYTPDADFNGVDTFTYRASDGTGLSNLATVTITVTAEGEAPEIVTSAGNQTTKGRKKVLIDPTIDLIDPDSPTFEGGHLNVGVTSGGGPKDKIYYRKGGAKKGFVNVKKGQLRVGTVVIGTAVGGKRGTPLLVEFNSNATQERVQTAMQSLLFKGRRAEAGPHVVSWQITDDTGLDSHVATRTVDVT